MDSGGPCPFRGPVADLVDPYVTNDTAGQAFVGLSRWLDAHPGRWAMFQEAGQGIDSRNVMNAGYEVAQRTVVAANLTKIRRYYARVPHPEGEALEEAIARSAPRAIEDLPVLAKDSFNWTKQELEEATRAARENLFPVRAARGSGRRKSRTR